MKLAIIFTLGLFSAMHCIAQDDHVRKLINYPRNSSIKTTKQFCTISSDKAIDSFEIIIDANKIIHPKKWADTNKITTYQFSAMHKADLKMQYDTIAQHKYAGLSIMEQLMNRANDIGGSIKFINEKNGGVNSVASENNTVENGIPINNDRFDT
jgi:hypothetical protein